MASTYCSVEDVADEMSLEYDDKISLSVNASAGYVDVANTESHRWASGYSVRMLNSNGYSEDRIINTVTYGTGATDTRITFTVNLTTHANFTTALTSTIQILSFFTALTQPSATRVEEMIEEAEDEIDKISKNSFKATNIFEGYIPYEPVARPIRRDYSTRYAFALPHSSPVDFSSVAGDEIYLWNGSSLTDYSSTWTFGRSDDFWFDKTHLYLRSNIPWKGRHTLYLKYRYGETLVPGNIKKASILMVCKRLLRGSLHDSNGLMRPAEGEQWPFNGYISWKEIVSLIELDEDLLCGA